MRTLAKETLEDESQNEEAESEESEEEYEEECDDPCVEDVSETKEGDTKHDSKDMPQVTQEPQQSPGQIPETAGSKNQDVSKAQADVEKGQTVENKEHEPAKVSGHSGDSSGNLFKDTANIHVLP